MNDGGGTAAELRAEVFSFGLQLGDDRRVGAKPDIQIFESVVIDEVELNVFVAAALAGGGVGCAQ